MISDTTEGRWRCRIFKGSDEAEFMAKVTAIRNRVFSEEQGMAVDHDPDVNDPTSTQLLISDVEQDDLAVATSRVLAFEGEPGMARIGRVAVEQTHRGFGLGLRLLRLAVREARSQGFQGALINGQVKAQVFYEKAGFTPEGEEFTAENRPHRRMRMMFRQSEPPQN